MSSRDRDPVLRLEGGLPRFFRHHLSRLTRNPAGRDHRLVLASKVTRYEIAFRNGLRRETRAHYVFCSHGRERLGTIHATHDLILPN